MPQKSVRELQTRPPTIVNKKSAILATSSSIQIGDDKLNARREKEVQQAREDELMVENKALAEQMARLESQIRNRLNNFEQVIGKVVEVINVNTRSYM